MFTLSNAFSFIRGPLAFFFLIDRVDVRVAILIIAAITDFIDGYIARLYKNTSKFGTILDPLMDKFFVYFALGVFLAESKLSVWGLSFMLSRDIAYFIFGLYVVVNKKLKSYSFRPLFGGKIMTILQFGVILLLSLGFYLFPVYYTVFLICGIYALVEVFYKELSTPLPS